MLLLTHTITTNCRYKDGQQKSILPLAGSSTLPTIWYKNLIWKYEFDMRSLSHEKYNFEILLLTIAHESKYVFLVS